MKKKKYLPLYEKLSAFGRLPRGYGLCAEVPEFDSNDKRMFALFTPSKEEESSNHFGLWWGGQWGRIQRLPKKCIVINGRNEQ
jgi:hypothetical protein